MSLYWSRLIVAVLPLFLMGTFPSAVLSHGEAKHEKVPEIASSALRLGGLLYDNWPKIVGAELEGEHPLYPASGKQRGPSTWRCKECHGWDYLGAKGRYAAGSHYTGIRGVLSAADVSEEEVEGILTGMIPGHDFSVHLDPGQRGALVAFLRNGLVNWSTDVPLEAGDTGIAGGEAAYEEQCSSCHGEEGTAIDLGKDEGVQGVGWIARKNPQETLHKIRWGHPGTDMPSAVADGGLSVAGTVNLLRFARQLD